MSKYYRKINSPYMRDKKGVFVPEFSDPVFEEYLDSKYWSWDYKWDGTSVGFEVGGDVFGRTEKTSLTNDQWETVRAWKDALEPHVGSHYGPVKYVYGELVGPGVQGNPHGFDHLTVVTFDCQLEDGTYRQHGVIQQYGLRQPFDHIVLNDDEEGTASPSTASAYGSLSLRGVINSARDGSLHEAFPDVPYMEGLVGRFWGDDRYKDGIITKIKVKDRWSW